MDVCAALIAHFEPSKAIEPRERSLHHPPVPPQSFTRLDPTPSNARDDAPLTQCLPTARIIVSLIGVQFYRMFAWSATAPSWETQRRNGVDSFLQRL